MNLRLALIVTIGPNGCTIRWLDGPEELAAQLSAAVDRRIKLRPQQLVAVDAATSPPTVCWRWFRGVVVYRRDDHVVVDNHVYQAGYRAPISVLRLPDVLEVDVQVGDEVFYDPQPQGAVIDIAEAGGPGHPARIAADLFPALQEVYAELSEQGGA